MKTLITQPASPAMRTLVNEFGGDMRRCLDSLRRLQSRIEDEHHCNANDLAMCLTAIDRIIDLID